MSELPLYLLVVLVVVAVALGLYVGARAGRLKAADDRRELQGKPMTQRVAKRARELATAGVVRMWKWNRGRKKRAREGEDEGDA